LSALGYRFAVCHPTSWEWLSKLLLDRTGTEFRDFRRFAAPTPSAFSKARSGHIAADDRNAPGRAELSSSIMVGDAGPDIGRRPPRAGHFRSSASNFGYTEVPIADLKTRSADQSHEGAAGGGGKAS